MPDRLDRWWPECLLRALFALWGCCNALNDVLVRAFQLSFHLGDAGSSLVQTAFYTGYFFGAPLAGTVARRFGFKRCVQGGLGLVCAGCLLFSPASHSFAGSLGCLYLIAFGLAFLETAANPWVGVLAERREPGSGLRALNFAQSFMPVGALCGVFLGRGLILGDGGAAPAGAGALDHVGFTYLLLGAAFIAVAAAVACTRYAAGDGRSAPSTHTQPALAVARECLRVRSFRLGVLTQFMYVGGQSCVWSFTIRCVLVQLPELSDRSAANLLAVSLGLFGVGRFAASALLRSFRPAALLRTMALAATVCCVAASMLPGYGGAASLCAVSFFIAMCFPTIFALSLASLRSHCLEVGGSLLVMSIVGGAVLTPLMGLFSDTTGSIRAAMAVLPTGCFVAVAAFAHAHAHDQLRPAEAEDGEELVSAPGSVELSKAHDHEHDHDECDSPAPSL